ncbi:glucose-induced degradation protein 8 homolog [Drosophila suzukii]|uniref:Glucose-induced degradation protein 8 homolog n=1 Tax=Drosophila suzukii TaxID=28584 RepID=A0AB39Z5X5_DROSZ|nr:glucose-induced degradation protein 8 homolog [Drosophila suzukii]XP_016928931.1 glucose-induced degradation protein 8 homolog [Drosophila suzukii]XP_016928932.1 glucose-induced degradation protein 8 homolog [Drosophila suzukii]XP_016928934.1 glucose-induced degradation protein 8 homolog [Drosophila suzukii]
MAEYKPSTSWPHRMMSFQCRQADLNRLVMNYLVTEGYQEAAKRFMTEASVAPGPHMNTIGDRLRIQDAVRVGQVKYAMDLATRIYPRLFETDNYVFFHMQQLRLIEMIRDQKMEKALKFAQSKAAGFSKVDPRHFHEVERTMGLLAFDRPEYSPYGELMYYSYRQKVAGEINAAMLRCQEMEDGKDKDEPMEPRMMFLIKLILWAQAKLDREGCTDFHKIDLGHGDFEEEFRRSFQGF